jgi:hypothetical protein
LHHHSTTAAFIITTIAVNSPASDIITALSMLTESRGRPAKFHALDHVFKNEEKYDFGNLITSEKHTAPYINWVPDDGSERKVGGNDQRR